MKRTLDMLRQPALSVLMLGLVLVGCEDSTGPDEIVGEEVAVVVNSLERSITVIPVDNAEAAFTVGLGPEGSPVSIATEGHMAVVPLGTYSFAAVVDLEARAVVYTVPLPANSGATGAAFINDSIALVANPGLNSVTPVNVRRGTAGAQIPVGVYPQAIITVDDRAYVLNGNLVAFSPAGPGSITVIDDDLTPIGTIPLTGFNPGSADVGDDGRLYVVNSGSFGQENGSLSVVNLSTRTEVSHYAGFGDFPGSIASADGRVFVTLYATGIIEWSPSTEAFVRGPSNPITPGDSPPVASIGFDSEDRLFVLNPGTCEEPGAAYRVSNAGAVTMEVETGICPFGISFAALPTD